MPKKPVTPEKLIIHMNAAYPLFDFKTNATDPFQIGNGLVVSKNLLDVEKLYPGNLSKEDKHHLKQAKYCLTVDKTMHKPEQASLLFVISCRLLKPTRVIIRYRVDDNNNVVSKIRDDYPFVPTNVVSSNVNKEELKDISAIFEGFNAFRKINARTSNASYFIGLAYRSRKWLESLLFHVCALETLISSTVREQEITKKFVDRLNFFIGYDKDSLRTIYNIRSKLVHGRYLAESVDENQKYFIIGEEVCRSVFKKILMDQGILNSFKDDQKRMKIFDG